MWITYYLVKKLGRKKALIATILLYIIGAFGDSYYGITIMNQITKNIYELIFKSINLHSGASNTRVY